MNQLVAPDLSIVGQVSGCLSYAESVFHSPHIEACATDAWHNTRLKHLSSEAIPTNVAFPVWFSWFGSVEGIYKDWGHVAIVVPGQGVYSSPYNVAGHKVSSSIAQIEHDLGAKYLGWSEDISTLRVIGGNVANITKEQETVLGNAVGAPPGANYDYRNSKTDVTTQDIDKLVNFWKDQSAVPALQAQNADLQKKLDAASSGTGFTQADRDTLNWIQKAIASIFRINI